MKINWKQIGISFLFCLTLIMSFTTFVFAEDIEIKLPDNSFNSVTQGFKTFYLESMQNGAENSYSDVKEAEFVPTYLMQWKHQEIITKEKEWDSDKQTWVEVEVEPYVKITEDYKKGVISELDSEDVKNTIDNIISSYYIDITFTFQEKSYKISFFPLEGIYNDNGGSSSYNNFVQKENSRVQGDAANVEVSKENLKNLAESIKKSIIAGSIGAGFNVGTPYSKTQRPLSDLMEIKGDGYDFKEMASVDFTLNYYFSPLFGRMYVADNTNEDVHIPKTEQEWVEYGNKNKFINSNGSLKLNNEFFDFFVGLSKDVVNTRGEKITDKKMENGAKGLMGSKDPQSVLSYNMQMGVPQLWSITNGKGQLFTPSLKIIDNNYIYCLYNDRIYQESEANGETQLTAVAIMSEICNRENVYLYNQRVKVKNSQGEESTQRVGVVLVGVFNECVVDTTEKGVQKVESIVNKSEGTTLSSADYITASSNLYLTGRKIYFSNGYSDMLDFKNANVKLMYTDSESGNIPYAPANVSFPLPGVEIPEFSLYDAWSAELAANPKYAEITKAVESIKEYKDDLWYFKYMNNKDPDDTGILNLHGAIPNSCKAVRMFINFGPISCADNWEDFEKDDQNSNTQDEQESDLNKGVKYTFYIVRNNNYIQDDDLITWLKSDTAKSMTYVKAEELLDLITGNFKNSLSALTYTDWLRMQEIKNELQGYQDNWLISIINVSSMVMGVFLIIFAILFMLCYWIDIFNAFTDFSVLQFVSFGNLYPVESKDLIPYVGSSNGKTKYVTFKNVLILSLIMIGFGILLLNVQYLIFVIMKLYYFIMDIFGVIGGANHA